MNISRKFNSKEDIDKEFCRIKNILPTSNVKLEEEFSGLFTGLKLSTPLIYPGKIYLRVQKCDHFSDDFNFIKRLSYPPSEITPIGRANEVKSPMFYCSDSFRVPFYEVGLKEGDHAVIGWWQQVKTAFVQMIGFHKEVFSGFGIERDGADSWDKDLDSYTLGQMGKLFMSQDKDYRFSIAVRKRLLSNIELKEPLPFDIEKANGFSGLVYPSVAYGAKNDNFAFHPEFADDGLNLVRADLCRINKICEKMNEIEITFLKHSSYISKHCVHWKDNSKGYPIWFVNTEEGPIGFSIIDGKFSRVKADPFFTVSENIFKI